MTIQITSGGEPGDDHVQGTYDLHDDEGFVFRTWQLDGQTVSFRMVTDYGQEYGPGYTNFYLGLTTSTGLRDVTILLDSPLRYDFMTGTDVLSATHGDHTDYVFIDVHAHTFDFHTSESHVPEGGATIALLGAGLTSLALLRRGVSPRQSECKVMTPAHE